MDPEAAARPALRGWLHLVGALVVVATFPLLLAGVEQPTLRAGSVLYVAALTAMLAVSATYHVPAWSVGVKRLLRRADHSAIFLGVAGTYTPITLAALPRPWSTVLLVVVWSGAAAGITIRNVSLDAKPWVSALPYVVLGWIAVLGVPVLWAFSPAVTVLVMIGGLGYTLGAVVYARGRPNPWPRTFGHHEVFHALTLVAIAAHWAAIRLAVTTPGAGA